MLNFSRTIVVDDSSWNNSVLLSFLNPLNWLLSKSFSVLNTEQGPENYEMFLERMYHYGLVLSAN